MEGEHYKPFLDIVVDVFYSIVLFFAFLAFPGLRIESFLMALSVFIMVNYWWIARSAEEFPKYYLIDYYFLVVVMFIFSQWSNYYLNVTYFLYFITIFFLVDCVWAITAIFAHKEKKDEPNLKIDFLSDGALAIIYFLESIFIRELNYLSLGMILAPYLIWFAFYVKRGLFETRFD